MSVLNEHLTQIDRSIKKRASELISLRRHFHANPELSRFEHKTTALLREKMEGMGYDVRVREEGVGIVADLIPEGFDPETHPTVAIRADMDALPIVEQNQVPYRSKCDGVMHACGHDVHMTCAVGAAIALTEVATEASLPGRLRVLFQHAEETAPSGAPEMIAFGALEEVDTILGLHCDPERPYGSMGVRAGALTASYDTFHFTILGDGGHGARPHQTVDPIFIGTQLANALYHSTARHFDARHPIVLSIGQFEGGHAPNVIPNRAKLSGTIRTIDEMTRAQIEQTLRRIAQGVTQTYSADFELDLLRGSPPIINHPLVTDVLEEMGRSILGLEHVERIPLPSMGSEDFANYLQHIPGAMFRLGTARADRPVYRLHSARFDIDERAIGIGARVLARSAIQLLHMLAYDRELLAET